MTIFDRFSIRLVAAGAGLCGAALVFSPDVTAAPLTTGGGYACIEGAAGQVGGGAPAAAGCIPAAAPVADMAGVPMALPGPVPLAPPVPVVPLVPPVPLIPAVPVVPAGAPLAAPIAGGAGVIDMANGFAGKGDPILPAAPGAPVSGQPIPPGPAAGH
ncbi:MULTISPECIES: hypothetical protein [unclassified Mycobacterium]|uniref:hypothetical protein n=1 Tax=unclassified Mycobacterium TaxID=2642494 RepID=UPI0029C8DD1A|nr:MULTISPECIES: hypothetical protein [unclassified Mycobacterium]